jgi:hypothetical protein
MLGVRGERLLLGAGTGPAVCVGTSGTGHCSLGLLPSSEASQTLAPSYWAFHNQALLWSAGHYCSIKHYRDRPSNGPGPRSGRSDSRGCFASAELPEEAVPRSAGLADHSVSLRPFLCRSSSSDLPPRQEALLSL